jgi:hypothetical protein
MANMMNNPEFLLKLRTVTAIAQTSNTGDSFFLQVSGCPVTSIRITTGEVDPNDDEHHLTHMHLTGEPEGYPNIPRDMRESQRQGYEKYLRRMHQNFVQDSTVGFNPIDINTYRTKFMRICEKFDAAVYQYHGVKCYLNGDMTDDVYANVVMLHLCDLMTIFIHERSGLPSPDVVLTTPTFMNVPGPTMRNDLMENQLTEEEKNFLEEHIDYFYVCYCYWGNFSFVPIRTRLSNDVLNLEDSGFFMNNPHFIRHQRGKLEELNRNNIGFESRLVYRSV